MRLDGVLISVYVRIMFTPLVIPEKPSWVDSACLAPTPRVTPAASRAIARLRKDVAHIERPHDGSGAAQAICFGVDLIDRALPAGGLGVGGLHEMGSAGPDIEHADAATLFAAGILTRLDGPILWVLPQSDLFAPFVADVGLATSRVVFVEAGKHVLPVMEEGLRHPGLAAVVAEQSGRLSLAASRRLQLAAEQAGILAILIRRSRRFDDPVLHEPTAALTRWRIAGLGRDRWQVDLTCCLGGETGSWMIQACDAAGRLGAVFSG
jgi:protein ImuA